MKPELDDWQFRMSKHPSPNATKIGDYFLETGAGINKVSVEDTDGISVGMLVGFPISLSQSRMLHEHYKLPFSLGDNTEDFVEKVFEDLGGKFLWMFFTKTIARIYVDCSAQIPCVYDKDTYFVGSTAYALLNDVEYQKRFDQDLYDFLKVEKDGWFPAGLTA